MPPGRNAGRRNEPTRQNESKSLFSHKPSVPPINYLTSVWRHSDIPRVRKVKSLLLIDAQLLSLTQVEHRRGETFNPVLLQQDLTRLLANLHTHAFGRAARLANLVAD